MERLTDNFSIKLHLGYSENREVVLNENLLALNYIEFYEKVCAFYSIEFGMYKVDTCKQICRVIDYYYKDKKVSDMIFDTVDRENILKLLIQKSDDKERIYKILNA